MPKKESSSSLKKPSQAKDKAAIQQTTPKKVPKPGKLGKEIDDIFGGRKKKKPELEKPETKETKVEIAKMNRKRKRNEREGLSNNNPRIQSRKRTAEGFNNENPRIQSRKTTTEGFRVYTEDELNFNKANSGDTPLCPFDCQCCF